MYHTTDGEESLMQRLSVTVETFLLRSCFVYVADVLISLPTEENYVRLNYAVFMMLRRVALERIDVSGKYIASIIRVTGIADRYLPPKCQFLEERHGVTSQTTAFFIVTAVKTSILHSINWLDSEEET
jgi:hypothetical protein